MMTRHIGLSNAFEPIVVLLGAITISLESKFITIEVHDVSS